MTSTGRAPYFVAIAPSFTRHPKVVRLGKVERRWTWLQVLCYAAEYGTGGVVDPAIIGEVVPAATPSFLASCVQLGLLDEVVDNSATGEAQLVIHSWNEFNGTSRERLLARERKRRQRETDLLEAEGLPDSLSRSGHADVTAESRAGHQNVPLRARASTSTSIDTSTLTSTSDVGDGTQKRTGWVEGLNRYTGVRGVRGEIGMSHVYDPLGTEPPPQGWPHPRPSRQEVIDALEDATQEAASS